MCQQSICETVILNLSRSFSVRRSAQRVDTIIVGSKIFRFYKDTATGGVSDAPPLTSHSNSRCERGASLAPALAVAS